MEPNFKEVERIITAALAEDIGKGDVTTRLLVPPAATASLIFVTREPMVMCGIQIASRVFAQLSAGVQTTVYAQDGELVAADTRIIEVQGPAHPILTGERVALNLLQRMCSVATLTAQYVKHTRGTKAVILDTRKTMPGLRVLDKYAVRMGGGQNHRMRLDDGILIKDNHIALCGGVKAALERARAGNRDRIPIEIECDTLAQVKEALNAGAQNILLDNMNAPTLREAVQLAAGHASLEASGNVTLDNVRQVAQTGVDFISVGRLTHSVPNVDIGLDAVITKN